MKKQTRKSTPATHKKAANGSPFLPEYDPALDPDRHKKPASGKHPEPLTVTLDPEASEMVRWAAATWARPADVAASGMVLDNFPQVKEEYELHQLDNQVESCRSSIDEAAARAYARGSYPKGNVEPLD